MQHLCAPWRSEYFSAKKDSCVFCDVINSDDDDKNGVLFRAKHCFGIMNLYPYSPGHFMIIPNQHTDKIEELDEQTWFEMSKFVRLGVEILKHELKGEGELREACKDLLKFGTKSVYLKCGEIEGKSLDIFYDGSEYEIFSDERIKTTATHGSGCSLSSAIASNLANGYSLKESVKNAHDYIFNAIKNAVIIGGGQNPVNHFYKFKV